MTVAVVQVQSTFTIQEVSTSTVVVATVGCTLLYLFGLTLASFHPMQ